MKIDDLTLKELDKLEAEIKRKRKSLTVPQTELLEKTLNPIIEDIKKIKQYEINFKITMKVSERKSVIENVLIENDVRQLIEFDIKTDKKLNKAINNCFSDMFFDYPEDFIALVPELDKQLNNIEKELDNKLSKFDTFDDPTFVKTIRKLLR